MPDDPQRPYLHVLPLAADTFQEDPMEAVFRKAAIRFELHLRSLIPPRPDDGNGNVVKFILPDTTRPK